MGIRAGHKKIPTVSRPHRYKGPPAPTSPMQDPGAEFSVERIHTVMMELGLSGLDAIQALYEREGSVVSGTVGEESAAVTPDLLDLHMDRLRDLFDGRSPAGRVRASAVQSRARGTSSAEGAMMEYAHVVRAAAGNVETWTEVRRRVGLTWRSDAVRAARRLRAATTMERTYTAQISEFSDEEIRSVMDQAHVTGLIAEHALKDADGEVEGAVLEAREHVARWRRDAGSAPEFSIEDIKTVADQAQVPYGMAELALWDAEGDVVSAIMALTPAEEPSSQVVTPAISDPLRSRVTLTEEAAIVRVANLSREQVGQIMQEHQGDRVSMLAAIADADALVTWAAQRYGRGRRERPNYGVEVLEVLVGGRRIPYEHSETEYARWLRLWHDSQATIRDLPDAEDIESRSLHPVVRGPSRQDAVFGMIPGARRSAPGVSRPSGGAPS